jgi:enolase
MGVTKAVQNIETTISENLSGIDASKQQELDKIMIELDGTQNKSRLGANAMLSVSMAVAKAAAKSSVLPLYLYLRDFIKKENTELKIPTPAFNILNGGKHAGYNLDLQDFLVIPASSKPFHESLEMGMTIYQSLRNLLVHNNLTTLIADEGGFAPTLPTNEDALSFVSEAISSANLRLGYDVFLGIDAAATSFFKGQHYKIRDKSALMTARELIPFYQDLVKKYHILYLEDPLAEDDWEGWSQIGKVISSDTIIIGDDLTVTNPYRLQMALDKQAISGIVIKPNQIGTVIEALAVVEVARVAGIKIIVSHRSGETNDDFIADFAVAVSADYVKFGPPVRGENIAKHNRLLEIERQLKIL